MRCCRVCSARCSHSRAGFRNYPWRVRWHESTGVLIGRRMMWFQPCFSPCSPVVLVLFECFSALLWTCLHQLTWIWMFKSAITKPVLDVFFQRFWSQTVCLPALRLLFTYQICTFLGGNKALQGSIWKHSISPAVSRGKGSQGWGGTPVQRVQFSWISFRPFLHSVFPYSPCAYHILNIFKWCSGLRKFCIPVEVKSIRLWWTGKAC